MSEDRFGSTNPNRKMNDTDKGYYEDLYNDLPKEVVDILMQTHPLMGKKEEDAEATAYRSRRPKREDVDEIREARMQQVGTEINEIRKSPQQEGDPTRHVGRRARAAEEGVSEQTNRRTEKDDYDDGIQYVSMMPAKKKSRIVEEITLQTSAPAKRKKVKQEDDLFQEFTMGSRPRYEEIDFEDKAKQEHLDDLYDDDYDDDDGFGGRGKIAIILGVIGLLLIIFLIFRCVSLSSKIEEAEQKVTAYEELYQKHQTLSMENLQLKEQLDSLQNANTNAENDNQESGENNSGENSTATNNTNNNTGTSNSGRTYTVQAGDTFWTIAESVYSNGSRYMEIVEANNMQENSTLSIGKVLQIP